MRIEYDDKHGDFRIYPDNESEFDIMHRIRKEIFRNDLIFNYYEYYRKVGYILAYSYETELIKIIEKMRDDKIERLLQIRNENEYVRLVARVMIEIWR